MGLGSWWRRWSAGRAVRRHVKLGDLAAARAALGDDRALARALADELLEAGDVEAAHALLGGEAMALSAVLSAEPAAPEVERLEVEARSPALPVSRVLALAEALAARGAAASARSLLEREALSRVDWRLLRPALEGFLEAGLATRAWPLVEAGFVALSRPELRGTPDHDFLLMAHRVVLSELENAEAVTVDLLVRGELDAFSGTNQLLLSKALMLRGPLATRLTLVPATVELSEGEARLSRDRSDATGLMLVGSAKFRLGELGAARDAFERGRLIAPRHFGLVAGLGAVRSLAETRELDRVAKLPKQAEPPGLAALVPDLEALTSLERRVVVASVAPLGEWVARLAAEGARLRVVPLDVRVTDLPEFEDLKGKVESRHRRAWDGLGGLAGDGLGCVRVEELFSLEEFSWTFAHEFAHLVHAVLPSGSTALIEAEWRHACEAEFAFDQYQLADEWEFFAVTYTRWLTRHYGFPLSHEPDAEGLLSRALATIDQVRAASRG